MNINANKIKIGRSACHGFKGLFYKGISITDKKVSEQLKEDMLCDNLSDLKDFVIDNNFGFNYKDFCNSATLQEACQCLDWNSNNYYVTLENNDIIFDIVGSCGFLMKYSFCFLGFENFTIDVERE